MIRAKASPLPSLIESPSTECTAGNHSRKKLILMRKRFIFSLLPLLVSGSLCAAALPASASTLSNALTADDDRNVINGLTEAYMWSLDGGDTWTAAHEGDLFKGRKTVTVAKRIDAWIGVKPYDSAKNYHGGDVVSYGKALWKASYWANPGEAPGSIQGQWVRVDAPAPTVVDEFTFTPWSGDKAAQYQSDERSRYASLKKVTGYFAEWGIYDAHNNYTPDKIDWSEITHVNYGFAVIKKNDGSWDVQVNDSWAANDKGTMSQITSEAAAHQVSSMISIGGWNNNQNREFEDATSTPEKIDHLAQSIVDFMKNNNFSGVDLDWEYPDSQSSGEQFQKLVKKIREDLDALGREQDEYYQFSVAVTPNDKKIPYVAPEKINDFVDTFNVMTYDYHGAFDGVTGHNSPLHQGSVDTTPEFNVASSMANYEKHGISRSKMLVGIPYYGRGWGDVTSTGIDPSLPGLGDTGTASVHGAWDDSGQFTGTNPYYKLKDMVGKDGYVRYWDDKAKVPYLYNESTKEFFTYDDEQSVQEKVDFINTNNYGGAIIWDMSGDDSQHTLGKVVKQVLANVVNQVHIDSAEKTAAGIVIRGHAEPGSRIKTTNDPNVGWYDIEGGKVYANADGSFTVLTGRSVSGEAVVKAFDPSTGKALSESNHVALLPLTATTIDSAVRTSEGIVIRGHAEPGSRIKTTNDPNVGWYDIEGGKVYANADGSFEVVTHRSIEGKAAVKSFYSSAGGSISESAHVVITDNE